MTSQKKFMHQSSPNMIESFNKQLKRKTKEKNNFDEESLAKFL